MAISLFFRLASDKNHHRGHCFLPGQMRYIKTFQAIRYNFQVQDPRQMWEGGELLIFFPLLFLQQQTSIFQQHVENLFLFSSLRNPEFYPVGDPGFQPGLHQFGLGRQVAQEYLRRNIRVFIIIVFNKKFHGFILIFLDRALQPEGIFGHYLSRTDFKNQDQVLLFPA